jgi:UDPglucose--hexose-1-phosphate uridylyltransferase
LTAFKRRYKHYENDHCAGYVMPIYNHGPQAGASIEHPHAQIFTSTIIPNIIEREVHHTQRYFEHNGACAFCDMIAHEKREKVRVIAENRGFIAFTLFAARFPFETWIMPKDHKSCYEDITAEDIELLAKICKEVFGKIGSTLNNPALNFFIHSAPVMFEETVYYHWHLEIGPRLALYGGYELGSGVIIDVVSPEKAAMYLRNEADD